MNKPGLSFEDSRGQRMIEAVMPVSDREPVRRNLDRATMALQSHDYFWRGSSPLILHIITPDPEFRTICDRLAPVADQLRRVEVRFRPESQISPVFEDIEGQGYSKQMLIKLAAYLFVETPFYITLDTDVVACKAVSPDDLVCNGKGVNDWIVPTTTIWYIRALDILGLDLSLAMLRFFVTPQVMSTTISRHLADFLTDRFDGRDWMYGLMQANSGQGIWSEYALYDLFAEHSGLLEQFHLPPGQNRLQSIEDGIWFPDDFAKWQPEKVITGERPGFFTVLQSITAHEVSFDDVRKRWLEAVTRYHPDYPRS